MTVVIAHLASDNVKNRYRARRAEKREQASADASLSRYLAISQNRCNRFWLQQSSTESSSESECSRSERG